MLDVRSWLHQLLLDPTVTTLLGAGANSVFQTSSFESVPEEKPFVVHRLGLSAPELKDDNRTVAVHQPVSVWIHDWPGDYLRIDAIADEIKQLLENAPSAGVMQAAWTGLGEELRDPEMGTILRVATFRLAHTP